MSFPLSKDCITTTHHTTSNVIINLFPAFSKFRFFLKHYASDRPFLFLRPNRFFSKSAVFGGIFAGRGAMKLTIFSCTLYLFRFFFFFNTALIQNR